ncbi:MAG: TRAP transporter small permease [Synergistaceae bacterium]|nr:TRAP transporter small permease [Synergistaceae bacterium]
MLLGNLAGLIVLVLGFMLFYEVICRYVLSSPTLWVQESAVYLYTWAMLTGSAYTLQKGKHVRIDLVVDLISPRTRSFVECLTSLAAGTFCILMTYQAYEMIASSLKYSKTSPTPLEVPLWVTQIPLLLGFALLSLQFFLIAFDKFAGSADTEEA